MSPFLLGAIDLFDIFFNYILICVVLKKLLIKNFELFFFNNKYEENLNLLIINQKKFLYNQHIYYFIYILTLLRI